MGDQPFVLRCHQAVLACFLCLKGKIRIGSSGQYHNALESAVIHMAGSVVKRGCVNLDSCSRRNQESFDLRCVICKIVFDILLASEKQYKVCHCHVDLGIPVIFHCVQLFVAAVAVSDLNGKSAESLIGQRLLYF